MIKLPEDINFKAVIFGDGANGAVTQVYSNDEYGVVLSRSKKNRDSDFETIITMDGVDGEFSTFGELKDEIDRQNSNLK